MSQQQALNDHHLDFQDYYVFTEKKTSPSLVLFNTLRYKQQMKRLVTFIFSIFARHPRAQFCLRALGRSIQRIKNIHHHSGSSVALEINKAVAINQRHGCDGNVMAKEKMARWRTSA